LALQTPSRPDRALEHLTHRALHRRAAQAARRARRTTILRLLTSDALTYRLRRLPARFMLHGVIAALVPLAFLLSQMLSFEPRVQLPTTAESATLQPISSASLPIGPIMLMPADHDLLDAPAPDSAFAEIAALPEAQLARSRQAILAPLTIASSVAGGQAHVRSGPGLLYDELGQLEANTALTLEAYAEDWFVARTDSGERVWIAAELVADAALARGLLAPAAEIPPPPPPRVAVVGAEGLSLRDGPGTAYVKLDSLPSGTTIDLLSRFEGWFEVRHPSGAIGWVTGDFLTIADGVIPRLDVLPSAPDPSPALVASAEGTINLRGGPGTAYPRVGTVGGGAQLELIARYQDWLKVRAADGRAAWVFEEVVRVSDYVVRRVPATRDIPALPKPKPAAPATVARGGSAAPLPAAQSGGVVSFAMQFRGTPYAWGGSGPAGFDCSGFTAYVYRQFGLSLPHSAAGQYSQRYGAFIDRASLQPGDIVFFANTYKRGLSHVGIYVGGGMVVQALAPGTPLAVVSMNGPYWDTKYYGALRPSL
jgi:cell wall-associated NlpC family hydrolase